MAKQASKAKILVCDDSEIVGLVVKKALEARGHTVVVLSSPFGFTATIKRERPDLVLLDVAMPALQGDKLLEVARRQDEPGCPIVYFSDRSKEELEKLAKESGAAGYIMKTGDHDELVRQVESYLSAARKPS